MTSAQEGKQCPSEETAYRMGENLLSYTSGGGKNWNSKHQKTCHTISEWNNELDKQFSKDEIYGQ